MDADNSRLLADSHTNLVGVVFKSAATWCYSTFSRQIRLILPINVIMLLWLTKTSWLLILLLAVLMQYISFRSCADNSKFVTPNISYLKKHQISVRLQQTHTTFYSSFPRTVHPGALTKDRLTGTTTGFPSCHSIYNVKALIYRKS